MNRRDMLKVVGAGVATSILTPRHTLAESGSPALRALAKKNFKFGAFTSVYATLPLEEAAKKIKDDGLDGVVMQYAFKDIHFDPLKPDWDVLEKINSALYRNELKVAGLYGYYNVVDPDAERRKQGEEAFACLARYWKKFGSPIISMETGTFNAKSEFGDDPKNFTEEGYQAVKNAFERLAHLAEGTNAVIAIEAYWRNCIDSVDRAARLFKEVNSPALKLTMDPANYFRNEQLVKMDDILDDMFKRLGDRIVIAHAKDVQIDGDDQKLPAAGKGMLDYPRFMRHLAELNRPIYIVIEHLDMSDVPRALQFVKSQIEKI